MFFGVGLITVGVGILFPILFLVGTSVLYTPAALYDHSLFSKTDELNTHNFFADNSILIAVGTVIAYLATRYFRGI